MRFAKSIYSLKFNNQLIVNYQICNVFTDHGSIFIMNPDRQLLLHIKPRFYQTIR